MEVKVFESFADIPEHIAQQCSYPSIANFFLSIDWFTCLYETAIFPSMKLRAYFLVEGADVLGALFCAHEENSRTLRSLSNFYTMEFDLAFQEGRGVAADAFEQLIQHIQSERPKWQVIDFRFIYKGCTTDSHIPKALANHDFSLSTFFMYENWYASVTETDFDEYYSALSSRLRNTIKRKENKLKKSHRYEISIFKGDNEGLEKAVEDYISIYNSSWKNPEPFPNFIPRLVSEAARLGILRLGLLYIDDRPAAAQLWINTSKKALIYKLAYDEAFSSYSPGSILSRELFRLAIDEDKVKEIDYGLGGENYKKDWMKSVREIDGLRAYNKGTLLGMTLAASDRTKTILKRALSR